LLFLLFFSFSFFFKRERERERKTSNNNEYTLCMCFYIQDFYSKSVESTKSEENLVGEEMDFVFVFFFFNFVSKVWLGRRI
jgi:hypothetical protein